MHYAGAYGLFWVRTKLVLEIVPVRLDLAHENLAKNDPVIIPCKVVNI